MVRHQLLIPNRGQNQLQIYVFPIRLSLGDGAAALFSNVFPTYIRLCAYPEIDRRSKRRRFQRQPKESIWRDW